MVPWGHAGAPGWGTGAGLPRTRLESHGARARSSGTSSSAARPRNSAGVPRRRARCCGLRGGFAATEPRPRGGKARAGLWALPAFGGGRRVHPHSYQQGTRRGRGAASQGDSWVFRCVHYGSRERAPVLEEPSRRLGAFVLQDCSRKVTYLYPASKGEMQLSSSISVSTITLQVFLEQTARERTAVIAACRQAAGGGWGTVTGLAAPVAALEPSRAPPGCPEGEGFPPTTPCDPPHALLGHDAGRRVTDEEAEARAGTALPKVAGPTRPRSQPRSPAACAWPLRAGAGRVAPGRPVRALGAPSLRGGVPPGPTLTATDQHGGREASWGF